MELVGRSYEVPELIEILLRERLFYETSEGGITLSGGEPTYQISFLEPLLCSLKIEGIQTTIQTNGLERFGKIVNPNLSHSSMGQEELGRRSRFFAWAELIKC